MVVQTGLVQGPEGPPRFRFPSDMLEDEGGEEQLESELLRLNEQDQSVEDWWEGAWDSMQRLGEAWRRSHPSQGYTELDVLVRESTMCRLAPGGWEFLEVRGFRYTTDKQAYQQLIRLQAQAKEVAFKTGQEQRLRKQLQTKAEQAQDHKDRKQRIHSLVTQLRGRKQLQCVQDLRGTRHSKPECAAQVLKDFWEGVMAGGGPSESGCARYMNTLNIPQKIRNTLPLLMKPLSDDVTLAALERLKQGSSSGKDGLPAELFQKFPAIFVPKMTAALQAFLVRGQVPDSWSVTLLKCSMYAVWSSMEIPAGHVGVPQRADLSHRTVGAVV